MAYRLAVPGRHSRDPFSGTPGMGESAVGSKCRVSEQNKELRFTCGWLGGLSGETLSGIQLPILPTEF